MTDTNTSYMQEDFVKKFGFRVIVDDEFTGSGLVDWTPSKGVYEDLRYTYVVKGLFLVAEGWGLDSSHVFGCHDKGTISICIEMEDGTKYEISDWKGWHFTIWGAHKDEDHFKKIFYFLDTLSYHAWNDKVFWRVIYECMVDEEDEEDDEDEDDERRVENIKLFVTEPTKGQLKNALWNVLHNVCQKVLTYDTFVTAANCVDLNFKYRGDEDDEDDPRDPSPTLDPHSLLSTACQNGNMSAIKYLVEYGELDKTDWSSPFDLAIQYYLKQTEKKAEIAFKILKLLHKHGARLVPKCKTELDVRVSKDKRLMKLLKLKNKKLQLSDFS